MINVQPRIARMTTNKEKILYKDLSYKLLGWQWKYIANLVMGLGNLKATGLHLAILLNFGKEKLKYERLVH